jgi:DNA-binding MarR family transcriptional regulator
MIQDIVRQSPALFLGTRLKRLGERMQADVLTVVERAGLPLQPSHYPLLGALDRYGPLSVGDLVQATGVSQPGVTRSLSRLEDLGLIDTEAAGPDRRRKVVALTGRGREMLAASRRDVWPWVEQAVLELCAEADDALLARLDAIEAALDRKPLEQRAAEAAEAGLSIEPFSDALAPAFHDINAEWIETMFAMEATDRDVLENPRARIIDPGGDILFARAAGLGLVGACALQKTGERQFELTKMGVLESARGRKAGAYLLDAVIRRANELGAETLYLLTNRKCAAAIHLYEKAGFVHDADIMARFGARYARCDVAMRYRGPRLASNRADA